MNRKLLLRKKGLNWYGPTWSFSAGGGAVNTPVSGAEKFALGTMETDSGWVNAGSPTTQERSNEQAHLLTYSRKIITDAVNEGAYNLISGLTGNVWYLRSIWYYITAGTSIRELEASGAWQTGGYTITPTASTWTQSVYVNRTNNAQTTGNPGFRAADAGSTFYADDLSIKPLTTSELLASVPYSAYDVVASVRINFDAIPSGVQAGLLLNLDSVSSPANYTLVYYNRADGKVYIDKCVAGVYTNKQATTKTYVAGAILSATKSGTSVTVTYNGAAVGVSQTIDDAGIISNTRHGLFSTGTPAQVQLSGFKISG